MHKMHIFRIVWIGGQRLLLAKMVRRADAFVQFAVFTNGADFHPLRECVAYRWEATSNESQSCFALSNAYTCLFNRKISLWTQNQVAFTVTHVCIASDSQQLDTTFRAYIISVI